MFKRLYWWAYFWGTQVSCFIKFFKVYKHFFLWPNSLCRAAQFSNSEGIFGFFCNDNHLSGGGVMQITMQLSRLRILQDGRGIILRTEHVYKVEELRLKLPVCLERSYLQSFLWTVRMWKTWEFIFFLGITQILKGVHWGQFRSITVNVCGKYALEACTYILIPEMLTVAAVLETRDNAMTS